MEERAHLMWPMSPIWYFTTTGSSFDIDTSTCTTPHDTSGNVMLSYLVSMHIQGSCLKAITESTIPCSKRLMPAISLHRFKAHLRASSQYLAPSPARPGGWP